MPLVSSPIQYPPSSSPPAVKRPRPEQSVHVRKPKAVGGFLLDDDSDNEGFAIEEPAPKRQLLEANMLRSAQQNGGNAVRDTFQDTAAKPAIERIGSESPTGNNESIDGDLVVNSICTASSTKPIVDHPELGHSPAPQSLVGDRSQGLTEITTCAGKSISVHKRDKGAAIPFEQMIAARSTTKLGRAKKSYYGVDIQNLISESSQEIVKEKLKRQKISEEVIASVECIKPRPRKTLMWTEKYRARNFMELVGDDRTHRQVLKWLKAWDSIVFPKSSKTKTANPVQRPGQELEETAHRKILLLTGPPGLGKTTLAHVCARQAGYEIMEINASDERSKDVVKNRIRTSVGTESVKTGSTTTSKSGHVQKNAHPLCVVVDEVDGVTAGSGGSGEGGFIKALLDLMLLDQKNSSATGNITNVAKKKKGDNFRLMRPLILICNDVYHPSLRPLRQSSFAEIIHVRKPPLDTVVTRMKSVFEKEGVSCDGDAVRRLCEATWGVCPTDSRKGKEGAGEGDLRGIMVVGEWAARKLKASTNNGSARLTMNWVEQNMMNDLSHGGGGARGIGRGGTKEVVNRVFLEGAGFPRAAAPVNPTASLSDDQPKTQLGVAELAKKAGMDRLREMVDTSGETDRIVTDIFSEYPNRPFNDDSILSKPDAAYEWLHFHDKCSSRIFSDQEFELAAYLSQPVLACHHLFASPARHHFSSEPKKWGQEEVEEQQPFSGPRADYSAREVERANRATIIELQSSLNATLLRNFRSPEDIAENLLPYVVRMLNPEVKPIVVGGSGDQRGIASVRRESEKAMVKRAVDIMGTVGVIFERGKLEGELGRQTQWVYRMEPPLDTLVLFETAALAATAPPPVRYAVRQVLDQEYAKNIIIRENAARQARYKAGGHPEDDSEAMLQPKDPKYIEVEKIIGVKRDFFGRIIKEPTPLQEIDGNVATKNGSQVNKKRQKMEENKVWVSFHEGFSNAVRKPLSIEELLRGL